MKRILSLGLVLCILALPMGVLAARGDATLLGQGIENFTGSIRGLAELNGNVYILTYDSLYTLESGQAAPVRDALALDPEAGEDPSVRVSVEAEAIFSYDGRICLVTSENTEESYGVDGIIETTRTVETVRILELAFDEEGNVVPGEELLEPDWSALCRQSDEYEYLSSVRMPFAEDQTLYCLSYDDQGNNLLVATDLEDGSCEIFYPDELFAPGNLNSVCGYREGRLMCAAIEWGDEENIVKLYSVDLAQEEITELTQLPPAGFSYLTGLAYSEETDTVYYIMSGQIFAMTGMDPDTLQSVAAIPITDAIAVPILTEEGMYIACDYQSVVRRNTDPAQRAETRLTVQDLYIPSISNAYTAFSNQRGDVEVILIQQVDDIIPAMMNRSSDVDIYCLDVSSPEYAAVFSRGYMAELSGSEKISSFMESCYPWVQGICTQEGKIVALPVEVYFSGGCAYNPKAFERLGLTEDDVPATWMEFLQSLAPIAEKVAQEPGMSLFDVYNTSERIRYTIFNNIFNEYTAYISQPGNTFAYDTPMFRDLLQAFENVPWDSLGLPSAGIDGSDVLVRAVGAGDDADSRVVYSTYCDLSANSYSLQSDQTWLGLQLSEEAEPFLLGNLYAVFINPFSENPDAAVAFLETLVDAMDDLAKIHFSPDYNDPIPSPYYESNLASYDETISTVQAQLASSEDAEDKEAYHALLEQYDRDRAEFMEYGAWDASEQSIQLYRTFADKITIPRNLGLGGENSEEFYTLKEQYCQGMISADEFVSELDGKLQMMLKEGM